MTPARALASNRCRRRGATLSRLPSARCSSTVRPGTTASVFGSSGIAAVPRRNATRGSAWLTSWPAMCSVPVTSARSPSAASTSSRCPFPATPATPTSSPRRTTRSMPFNASAPRSPSTRASRNSSTVSFVRSDVLADRTSRSVGTDRPTIASTRPSSSKAEVGSPRTTTFPWRITVTRSDTARASRSLWVMMTNDRPCCLSSSIPANNASTSCGARTLVGSSRMTTRAPAMSTLRISTRCRSPIDNVRTVAPGSTARP